MPHPPTWNDILIGPTFVVNLAASTDRLAKVMPEIQAAGFCNCERWAGVDARVRGALEAGWARHQTPTFDPSDGEFVSYPGKQGCFLSHIDLWAHIIKTGLPYATIFEDDVCFHSHWRALAPEYFAATPTDYHLMYFGNQIDYMMAGHIQRTPVFCTHAYVITLEGARICYNALMKDIAGVRTIDCMLIDHMKRDVFSGGAIRAPFNWYAWNGTAFFDPRATSDPDWAKRNTGLVFQDVTWGSLVRHWP
jgi:GR25 family glycosyltransferase involved in LPS biosynthesis